MPQLSDIIAKSLVVTETAQGPINNPTTISAEGEGSGADLSDVQALRLTVIQILDALRELGLIKNSA